LRALEENAQINKTAFFKATQIKKKDVSDSRNTTEVLNHQKSFQKIVFLIISDMH